MHILDIAENSVNAGADNIRVTVVEDSTYGKLTLEVTDDGSGMNEELLQAAKSPFTTTRTTRRRGLGLPLLAQAAEATNGELKIESKLGKGTKVVATFQQSHVDCKPVGDIGETIMSLIVGYPDVDFRITYRRNGAEFLIDSRLFRAALNGLHLSHPEAIGALRSLVNAGLHDLEPAATTPAEANGVLSKGT